MVEGTAGDPHDFCNGRFGNRFRQESLHFCFSPCAFCGAQRPFGPTDLPASRVCGGKSLLGPLGKGATRLLMLLVICISAHLCRESNHL